MTPRRASQGLTEVELEFMHILWEAGEATPAEVVARLERRGRPRADGSVRKILSILMRKGHVTRRREGRGYVYRARASKARTRASLVGDLLQRAFGGSPALLMASLLERPGLEERDLARIKELISEYEEEEAAGGGGAEKPDRRGRGKKEDEPEER